MAVRWLALLALLLTGGYALAYVVVVGSQHGSVAWWYLASLAVGAAALLVATAGRRSRAALGVAVVVLWLGVLVGVLSVGLLLLPAAVVAGIALLLAVRRVSRDPVGTQ
ncbi:MAG: hypothetical protein ACR2LI_00520 [Propionibacteriaceae bacterium]